MHIGQLKESKFLKKEDVGSGLLLTIQGTTMENVSLPGAPEELKCALHFDEVEKPLILNSTNGQIIALALGSEETDDWKGKKIVLFTDPSIQFQGKLVGGIRARAVRLPKQAPAAAASPARPAPAPKPAVPAPVPVDPGPEAEEDDVPF